MLSICEWHGDKEAAAVLTIDDLSYGYVDMDGTGLTPQNDWGYVCRDKNGIYSYFKENFIKKHPEVKYTVFVPFGKHSMGMVKMPYQHYAGDIFENNSFLELLSEINSSGNEIAYHGHNHGFINPKSLKEWTREQYQYSEEEYAEIISNDIYKFKNVTGWNVRGGRSPGYNSLKMEKVVKSVGFEYWSFDYKNKPYQYTVTEDYIRIPTFFSGSRLNFSTWELIQKCHGILNWELELQRCVKKKMLINVTEHFLRSRADGRKQTPAIYDDIQSMDIMFSSMKKYDLWYAPLWKISRYIRAKNECEVVKISHTEYEVKGKNNTRYLSFCANMPYLLRSDGKKFVGKKKSKGDYIFYGLLPGIYGESIC